MNKLTRFFYERNKIKLEKEVEENGLKIIDEEKFHRRVLKASKNSIVNTVILVFLIIYLALKWTGIV